MGRKTYLFLILLFVLPAYSQTFVNTCARDNGGFSGTSFTMSTCAGTGSLNHTTGNFLFAAASWINSNCAAGGTVTLSNTAGDTWTAVDKFDGGTSGTNSGCIATFYVPSTAGNSADNITITTSNSVFQLALVVDQFSGMAASPLDVHGVGGEAFASTVTSASFSTAQAAEVIFAPFGNMASFPTNSAGSMNSVTGTLPTNSVAQLDNLALEYWITTATQSSITASASISATAAWLATIVNSFKASAGGGLTSPQIKSKQLVKLDASAMPNFCSGLTVPDCNGFTDGIRAWSVCLYSDGSCATTTVPANPSNPPHICLMFSNLGLATITVGALGSVAPGIFVYECTP